jgi:hypothetical protein
MASETNESSDPETNESSDPSEELTIVFGGTTETVPIGTDVPFKDVTTRCIEEDLVTKEEAARKSFFVKDDTSLIRIEDDKNVLDFSEEEMQIHLLPSETNESYSPSANHDDEKEESTIESTAMVASGISQAVPMGNDVKTSKDVLVSSNNSKGIETTSEANESSDSNADHDGGIVAPSTQTSTQRNPNPNHDDEEKELTINADGIIQSVPVGRNKQSVPVGRNVTFKDVKSRFIEKELFKNEEAEKLTFVLHITDEEKVFDFTDVEGQQLHLSQTKETSTQPSTNTDTLLVFLQSSIGLSSRLWEQIKKITCIGSKRLKGWEWSKALFTSLFLFAFFVIDLLDAMADIALGFVKIYSDGGGNSDTAVYVYMHNDDDDNSTFERNATGSVHIYRDVDSGGDSNTTKLLATVLVVMTIVGRIIAGWYGLTYKNATEKKKTSQGNRRDEETEEDFEKRFDSTFLFFFMLVEVTVLMIEDGASVLLNATNANHQTLNGLESLSLRLTQILAIGFALWAMWYMIEKSQWGPVCLIGVIYLVMFIWLLKKIGKDVAISIVSVFIGIGLVIFVRQCRQKKVRGWGLGWDVAPGMVMFLLLPFPLFIVFISSTVSSGDQLLVIAPIFYVIGSVSLLLFVFVYKWKVVDKLFEI